MGLKNNIHPSCFGCKVHYISVLLFKSILSFLSFWSVGFWEDYVRFLNCSFWCVSFYHSTCQLLLYSLWDCIIKHTYIHDFYCPDLLMEFQLSYCYFKSWKMMLLKCCTQYTSKFGKLSSDHRIGKGQCSFQSQRRAMPMNVQTTTQLHSSHMLVN